MTVFLSTGAGGVYIPPVDWQAWIWLYTGLYVDDQGCALPVRAKEQRFDGCLGTPAPRLRSKLIRLRASKFIVSVNGVCVNPHRQMLMLEQRYPNGEQWNLPGGLLKRGEDPAEGLRREIREETGLVTTVDTLLSASVNGLHMHFCYLCYVLDGQVVIQNSEILSFAWTELHARDPCQADVRRDALRVPDSNTAGQGNDEPDR